jgi:hypothetical protein
LLTFSVIANEVNHRQTSEVFRNFGSLVTRGGRKKSNTDEEDDQDEETWQVNGGFSSSFLSW